MFILRRINSEKLQSNEVIGNSYVITSKLSNEEKFNHLLLSSKPCAPEKVYAFICYDIEVTPLYEDSLYYIMTSDGKTFSNISKKD